MKLFQLSELSHYGEYKFYTVKNIIPFMDKKRQNIEANIKIELTMYEGKNKKEKSKDENFNISTSLPYFFVDDNLKREMEDLNMNIEFIQVNTSDSRKFYLVRPLTNINIISFKDKKDLLEMAMENKYIFNKNVNLDNVYLFKDPCMDSETFFTEDFYRIFNKKLRGAYLEEIFDDMDK